MMNFMFVENMKKDTLHLKITLLETTGHQTCYFTDFCEGGENLMEEKMSICESYFKVKP